MGFTGIMLVAAIFCLCKAISRAIIVFRWLPISVPVVGTIGDPVPGKEGATYNLHFDCAGESYTKQYCEGRLLEANKQIKLRFNPYTKDYISYSELYGTLLVYLGVSLLFAAMVCVILHFTLP